MTKSIFTNNSFIRLYYKAGNFTYQSTGFVNLGSIYVSCQTEAVVSRFESHDNFFQRSISRPLTDAIYSTFYLPGSFSYCLKAVGYSKTKVVMTMNAEHCFADIGHFFNNVLNEISEFTRYGIAYGIRNIHRSGSCLNHCLQYLIYVCGVGATGIHRRKLYIVGIFSGSGYHIPGNLQYFITALF